MKQIMAIALLITISYSSFSQIQRQPQKQTDSTASAIFTDEENQPGKYHALKDLNLSEKQKLQLKELRNAFKNKKASIDNDISLTDEVRSEKLKEIKKEQAKAIKSILTKEQKIKLRRMMMEKKRSKNTGEEEVIE